MFSLFYSFFFFIFPSFLFFSFFFFNDTATTEIYTLSLHDALPILVFSGTSQKYPGIRWIFSHSGGTLPDRKSTRLNSSHPSISYAVFCLKKKKKKKNKKKKKTKKKKTCHIMKKKNM